MTDLPPHLRALLDASRGSCDPSPLDAARVRAKIDRALASGPDASHPADTAPHTGGSGAISAPLGAKWLLLGVALVGGAAGLIGARVLFDRDVPGAVHARGAIVHEAPLATPVPVPALATPAPPSSAAATVVQSEPHPRGPTRRSSTRLRSRVDTPPKSQDARADREPARTPAISVASEPEPHAGQRPASAPPDAERSSSSALDQPAASAPRPPASSAHTGSEPASSPTPELLAEPVSRLDLPRAPAGEPELALIRRALEAINHGAPERGLRLLQTHLTRYPRGVLSQERAGLRVLALCAAGQQKRGRLERAAFLEAHARSPLGPRVQAACDGED